MGYRWYDAHAVVPRYPFGHGLSYTTFDYEAECTALRDEATGAVSVELGLTNAGGAAGSGESGRLRHRYPVFC